MPPFDPEMVQPVQERLAAKGVELRLGDGVKGFEQLVRRSGMPCASVHRACIVCCSSAACWCVCILCVVWWPAWCAWASRGRGSAHAVADATRPCRCRCCSLARAHAQPGERLAVTTAAGARIEGDMVMLLVGVKPETRLAVDAGLALGERGGIRVDEHMRTSDPSIWAVGALRWRAPVACAQHVLCARVACVVCTCAGVAPRGSLPAAGCCHPSPRRRRCTTPPGSLSPAWLPYPLHCRRLAHRRRR